MTRVEYIKRAREQYEHEGDIEIDDNAVLSRGSDGGAYVQAWVWVEDENAPEGGSEDDPDADSDDDTLVKPHDYSEKKGRRAVTTQQCVPMKIHQRVANHFDILSAGKLT